MSLGFWNEMGCLWGEKNLKLYVNEKKGDNMMNTLGTAVTLVFWIKWSGVMVFWIEVERNTDSLIG